MLAPSSSTSPVEVPPEKRGTSPVTMPSSVDLPDPVGPETSDQLALLDRQVDVGEDGRVGVPEADAAQLQEAHADDQPRLGGEAAAASSPSTEPSSAIRVTCGNDARSG